MKSPLTGKTRKHCKTGSRHAQGGVDQAAGRSSSDEKERSVEQRSQHSAGADLPCFGGAVDWGILLWSCATPWSHPACSINSSPSNRYRTSPGGTADPAEHDLCSPWKAICVPDPARLFGRMASYKADPQYTDKRLTDIDKKNVKIVLSVEQMRGGPLSEEEHTRAGRMRPAVGFRRLIGRHRIPCESDTRTF